MCALTERTERTCAQLHKARCGRTLHHLQVKAAYQIIDGWLQKSKGQKRRERLEAQEAQRENEVAEAVASMGVTARVAEEDALHQVLQPLGLQVVDIPVCAPPGHFGFL